MKIDTIEENNESIQGDSRQFWMKNESNQENFESFQCFRKSYTIQKLLIQFIEQETNTRKS